MADVSGEKVAFGFLCGRDYKTQHFVSKNRSGFDLLTERTKVFPSVKTKEPRKDITIGIPATLHMFEELSMWKRFFSNLSDPLFPVKDTTIP